MKTPAPLALALALACSAGAQEEPKQGIPGDPNISLKREIELSIQRGLNFLQKQQNPETGAWGDETIPALSALALLAHTSDPTRDEEAGLPENLKAGYRYLIGTQKTDGGLYVKGLACYNTALALTALMSYGEPEADEAKLRARRFLINQQSDFDVKGESDNPFDGGIGYGGTYAHSDLSNTHFVLESLYYSQALVADSPGAAKIELDYDAAIAFVSRCQNLEGGGETAVTDENRGGFVYFPGNSKAGQDELPDGRIALRSYGSISYAGLLSFVYAGLEPDDPRVVAVMDWLQNNYTLEENPGMGQEGLYYYYHTLAKALSLTRTDTLELPGGEKINWRTDLAKRYFDLQKPDGSWQNPTGRWMEGDPVLSTSFAVISLARIHSRL